MIGLLSWGCSGQPAKQAPVGFSVDPRAGEPDEDEPDAGDNPEDPTAGTDAAAIDCDDPPQSGQADADGDGIADACDDRFDYRMAWLSFRGVRSSPGLDGEDRVWARTGGLTVSPPVSSGNYRMQLSVVVGRP